jgi:phosphomannomutase
VGSTFITGGDVRLTTPQFLEALIEGLSENGVNVIHPGVVPTPMVYFAKRFFQADGCAMVTASHSPPDYNGLKWMIGEYPPGEEEVQALRRFAQEENHQASGNGRGTLQAMDILLEYRRWLVERFRRSGKRVDLSIIVDPGNGCWAGLAANLLKEIFPACRVESIHDRPDGRFQERNPDSAKPEYLTRLAQVVKDRKADVGIAFDGDGDRVSFMDSEGVCLSAEQTAWILLHGFGGFENEKFVYDLKSSSRLAEAVESLGGQALAERSGHAFIRTRMIRENALFGAEISGHFFYRELHGGDDGLFTACFMLGHLAQSGQSLSGWRKKVPPIFMTPDLRVPATSDQQEAILLQVKELFSDLPQSYLDGVRIDFPEGWVLVRKSVTAPELTFRFEGHSREDLHAIIARFHAQLPSLGDYFKKCSETIEI